MRKIFLKRLIAKMLVVSMMFLSVPITAFAEESGEEPIVDGGGEAEAVSGSAIEVTPSSEYNLIVKDIYSTYDSEGNFIEQVEQIRSSEVVPDGFTYSFDPLDPSVFAQYYVGDYYKTTDITQSGTVSGSDVTIYFHYSVPTYELSVYDKYGAAFGNFENDLREQITLRAGQAYDLSALPDFQMYSDMSRYTNDTSDNYELVGFTDWTFNFTVVGESQYSGVAMEDKTLTFNYECTNPIGMLVVQDYFDNVVASDTADKSFEARRCFMLVPVGEAYSVSVRDISSDAVTKSGYSDISGNWDSFSLSGNEWTVNGNVYTGDFLDSYLESVSSNATGLSYGIDYTNTGYKNIKNYEGTMTKDNVWLVFRHRLYNKENCQIAVIDNFLNDNGTSRGSNTRIDTTEVTGESYNFSALTNATLHGDSYEIASVTVTEYDNLYNVVSENTYSAFSASGVISNFRTVISFNYRLKVVVPTSHSLKVYDHIFDHNGETIETRLDTTIDNGQEYEFLALSRSGWKVQGANLYDGIATGNIEIHFYYIASTYYKLEVKDHFGDDIEIRDNMSVVSGTNYNYSALDIENWTATGVTSYSGKITADTTLDFYYTAKEVTPIPELVYATVKGQLTYADGSPVANKKVEIHSSPRYTYTNDMGYYEFENVEVGEHTLTIYDNENVKLLTCTLEVKESESNKVEVVFKNDCEVTTDISDIGVIKVNAILSVASPTPVPSVPEQNEPTPTESPSKPVIENPVATEPTPTPTPTPSETVEEKKHYIIQVIDYTDNAEVRESMEVEEGTYYSYDAVEREGWSVIGKSHYEGYVNGNIKIEFHYTENAVPTPIPEPTPIPIGDSDTTPIVTPAPVPKHELDDEPRTGDMASELPLSVMLFSLSALIGLLLIRRKNRR